MFKQDQEIFNILLESVSDGVIIVDNHQKIMEVNASAIRAFGYDKKEMLDVTLNKLMPSNYHENHSAYFEQFVKKGKRRMMGEAKDIYGLKKDGTIFPLEVELNPFSIYNKTYVMALIRDISEKKEAERNLMLRNIALQSAKNGVIITDALKKDNPVIYLILHFKNSQDILKKKYFTIIVAFYKEKIEIKNL